MINLKTGLTLITTTLFSVVAMAQVDFNNYTTLKSKGSIPSDFTKETYTKVEDDLKEGRDELSKTQERIFLEGTNYAIDEILHSGFVVYGDEISTYVTEIADRLLRNDYALRSKLRFYTIKSNAANAFSTDQGIVFVTTGLIAQLTSEAQLAYVLAHEISHYTEKHVVETFDWKTENYRQHDRIEKLSQYSKDKEFEADKLGIKMYKEAGYSADEIITTFDVLMYSYLPFDELEFPKTHFNSDKLFIPLSYYPTKKYEIKAEEDYDDEHSSHPNIKKRKEAAMEEIGTLSNWETATQFLGNDRFLLVRNITRFEGVRSDILDAAYADAMYSVFILEKDFPNSIYLKRMTAQIWMNLMLYEAKNISSKTMDKTSELEGESATLHFMLKKLNNQGMITLALRHVYDLHKNNPDDAMISAIYDKFIVELAKTSKFKLDEYSKKNFETASKEFIELHKDTVPVVDTIPKSNSKYDRIKSKKNVNNSANFDSTKFYLYALTDVISDSNFISRIEDQIKLNKEAEEKENERDELSSSERKKLDDKEYYNRLKLGLEEIIVVEPKVYSYTSHDLDYVKSEKIEKIYSNAIQESAEMNGVKVHPIDRMNLQEKGTASFNERNTLIAFLGQIAEDDDINVFPVDFEDLRQIKDNYGTSKVMFTLVEHQKIVDINWWTVAGSAVIYPAFPFVILGYIPMKIFKSNHTEMSIIILDLEKGIVETGENYYWSEPIYKYNLGSHMYNIFHDLKSQPL